MSLTRDQILSNKSFRSKTIQIDEWGGEVRLKAISGAEREALEDAVYERIGDKLQVKKGASLLTALLLRSMCDDDGNRLFQDGDIEFIRGIDSVTLNKLFKVAADVNGLSGEEEREIEKNSEAV